MVSEIIKPFLGNVQTTAQGCWVWQRGTSNGYGMVRDGSRTVRAHRRSWELYWGVIPRDLQVIHTCGIGLCVNPDHLFLGTHKDNMRNMASLGRCGGGKRKGCVPKILTPTVVYDARVAVLLKKETITSQADQYGVDRTTMSCAINGKTWKKVPMPRVSRETDRG